MTKVADAIELYQNAAEAVSSAMDESCIAVRAYHRTALAEMVALHRGEPVDLKESARAALRLQRAIRAERSAGTRVEDARFAVLQALLEADEHLKTEDEP